MNQPTDLVTIMVIDVTGSTELHRRLSDVEAARAVERCLKRITRCIESFRGRTLKIIGYETLAAFDSTEDACHAAIEVQTRIDDLPPISGLKLTVRIGLHSGVLVDGLDLMQQETVLTTARTASHAAPGQIYMTESILPAVPQQLRIAVLKHASYGHVVESDSNLQLLQLSWRAPPPTIIEEKKPLPQLIIFYHDAVFTLTADSPVFTMGRDHESSLLVNDSKASRKHGRIEMRKTGFFYVDSSTNGSFITFNNHSEHLLHRKEVRLENYGRVCFGASGREENTDFFTFEQM
jgi:hypothetical protein